MGRHSPTYFKNNLYHIVRTMVEDFEEPWTDGNYETPIWDADSQQKQAVAFQENEYP